MANYATLKAAIQQVIKTNGNNEITGALLQQSLLAMITSLGAGYQFMGVAVLTPTPTAPGTPDQNVFYFASEPGIYSNFGNLIVANRELAVFLYNGSWTKQTVAKDFISSSEFNDLLAEILAVIGGAYVPVTGTTENGYYYNSTSGEKTANPDWSTFSFVPQDNKIYYANGFVRPSVVALALYFDVGGSLISIEQRGTGANQTIENYKLTIPAGTAIVRITGSNTVAGIRPSVNLQDFYNGNIPDEIAQLINDELRIVKEIVTPLTGGTQGQNIVSVNQVVGATISFGTISTHTKYTIPANRKVKITTISGGYYGFAITDQNDKVLEFCANSVGEYTFAEYNYQTYLYVSDIKLSSANIIQTIVSSLKDIVESLQENVEEINENLEQINDDYDSIKNTLQDRIQVTGTFEDGCYYYTGGGVRVENPEWNTFSFVPEAGKQYYANGFVRPSAVALALYFNSNNSLISIQEQGTGTNQEYTNFALTIPEDCVLVRITGNGFAGVNASANYLGIYQENVPEQIARLDERIDNIDVETNHWKGKKIWWCGTSIPAGSDATIPGAGETVAGNYPTQVGTYLGATVINKSVGGSMCRANVRTGNYVGANFSNITSCLSMTKAEIENFIANYSTIKDVLTGNPPETLSASTIARLRSASFEDRLLPYLNGTYDMPDLFVIDHGHNDFKYSLSGGGSDIGLKPTIENIGGELADDAYMTANNNQKLESFFGSLANIPTDRKAEFVASVNRNCYIGAVNFIITLILKYNPHARIVFISNYEYENGAAPVYAPLIPAQNDLSESWAFPICWVYKYLGYSRHLIPGSMAWFNNTYTEQTPATTDITVYRAYLPDGVHPHSDITGDANAIYAGIIAEFLKTCR